MLLKDATQSLPVDQWIQLWTASAQVDHPMVEWSTQPDINQLISHLSVAFHPVVLIDCTSSEDLAAKYPSLLRQGFHIVTPNKKAFSSDYGLYRDIAKITKKSPGSPYPLCLHEATVGKSCYII